MVEFFVLHSQGDRLLRKSSDDFGEVLYEPVVGELEINDPENIVKSKCFTKFKDVFKLIKDRIFVMKVKNHRQVYFNPSYSFERQTLYKFLCPNTFSSIELPVNNPYVVFWELSKLYF